MHILERQGFRISEPCRFGVVCRVPHCSNPTIFLATRRALLTWEGRNLRIVIENSESYYKN